MYFYQVQMQLFVCKRLYCDFVVCSPTMMSVEKIMSDAKATVTTRLRGKGKLTAVGMKNWFQYYRNAIVKNAPDVEATHLFLSTDYWNVFLPSADAVVRV